MFFAALRNKYAPRRPVTQYVPSATITAHASEGRLRPGDKGVHSVTIRAHTLNGLEGEIVSTCKGGVTYASSPKWKLERFPVSDDRKGRTESKHYHFPDNGDADLPGKGHLELEVIVHEAGVMPQRTTWVHEIHLLPPKDVPTSN